MEKEKLIVLIEMLQREIEEISKISKVGHRVICAECLLSYIKSAVSNENPIDLGEIYTRLEICEVVKNTSDGDIIEQIKKFDPEALEKIAFFMAEYVASQKSDDEQMTEEDIHLLKEYNLFLLKNKLIGKTINTVEHNGFYAEQFQNFKILFSKENGEVLFCDYHRKATKQELKKLIDDIKSGKAKNLSKSI